MRTTKQQINLDTLIIQLQSEYNFEEILKDKTIFFKQTFLLNEFEKLFLREHDDMWYDENPLFNINIDVVKEYNETDELEEITKEYIRFFYLYRTYIIYFEHFEKYEMCSLLSNMIPLVRVQYINEMREYSDYSFDKIYEYFLFLEEEVINFTKEIYG